MKGSNYNEEPPMLLSKKNTKALLVRNAINQDTLKKQARLLEKERNSGERLFLKKREHLLQRQASRILETSQSRPSSSCSVENAATKWKNAAFLTRESTQSPKPRRKEMDGNNSLRQTRLFSSISLEYEENDKQPSLRQRSKTFSPMSSAVSLPDIHATSNGIVKKYSDTQLPVSDYREKSEDGSFKEAVCIVDEWKNMRKCRYLRARSGEEELCAV